MAKTNSSDVAQAVAVEAAAINPALMAVIDLEERFVDMACMMEAFDQVAGDNSPPWLVVVWAEFKRLELALDSVSTLVRASREVVQ